MANRSVVSMAGAPSRKRTGSEVYRAASSALRSVLDLGDAADAAGDTLDAAECLLGALSDLAPELAALARLR